MNHPPNTQTDFPLGKSTLLDLILLRKGAPEGGAVGNGMFSCAATRNFTFLQRHEGGRMASGRRSEAH